MKHVKLFEGFTNEETYHNTNGKVATNQFGPEEHLDFCKTVSEWIERNHKAVLWCLYARPEEDASFGLKIERAESFWRMYVNGNKKFTIIEMDDKLIGVLHENGNILMAFDEMDIKVDHSVVSGLL